ncbi:MAG: septum formation initiator family protein [Candidatus Moraniibacteriota bacterium]
MKKKFPIIVVYFVVGVFFAGLISYSAVKEAYRNRKIETEVEALRQEAEKIQKENDILSRNITYLGSQDSIKKTAKNQLNMQEQDENVVMIKPSVKQAEIESVQIASEEKPAIEKPNYQKWLNLFFKYN